MGRKRELQITEEPPLKKAKLTKFEEDEDGDESEERDSHPLNEKSNNEEEKELIEDDETLPGWMKYGQVLENWKEVPVEKLGVWLKQGIQDRLIKSLPPAPDRDQLTLFPVQAAVLPGVIRGVQQVQDLCPLYNSDEVSEITTTRKPIALGAGDVLVCAPTGSGKTVAYVLPIVQALESRIIPRTRALVLLPSRDLATQVYSVFKSLIDERKELNHGNLPLRIVQCLGKSEFGEEQKKLQNPHICDIIIATPGRLMDHLNAGFSLKHLQYLIIDEADRLLMQSYQDWALRILTAARNNDLEDTKTVVEESIDGYTPPFSIHTSIPSSSPLRKYLFSATLTRNPAKIANLHLQNPLYFHAASSGRFTIPESLEEYEVVCQSTGEKPLVLVHLLQTLKLTQTLCFTKSVEATHRLFILLKYMNINDVFEYSSTLSQASRTNILQQFRSGNIKLLICSDAMARGMDIDDVGTVINYDSPGYIKTYVHRAGRTARAGKSGNCYTILATGEAPRFHKMRRKAEEPERVKPFTFDKSKMEEYIESYNDALGKLKSTLDEEKQHHYTGKSKRKDNSNK